MSGMFLSHRDISKFIIKQIKPGCNQGQFSFLFDGLLSLLFAEAITKRHSHFVRRDFFPISP